MPELRVDTREESKNYPIIIKNGLKEEIGFLLTNRYRGDKILLVTDDHVQPLYGQEIEGILNKTGYDTTVYIVPHGEEAKSLEFLKRGYDLLVEKGFNRDNLVIALGGGVVGDLAGLLAATFMRGVSLVQIPTTLLAQVDSSVGGKTAINHTRGKNLIGAFFQPDLVLIDPEFLQTLPERELKTGMAEVIKYGLIADQGFFSYLLNHCDQIYSLEINCLLHIIYRSCSIKAEIVSEDEKETGVRAILNFGHTIGHAIESVTSYRKYNHGEAVAIGMIGAGRISSELGFLSREELAKIEQIIKLYRLPYSCHEDMDEVFKTLFLDKKVKENKLRWILLARIGQAIIKSDLDEHLIKDILEGLI